MPDKVIIIDDVPDVIYIKLKTIIPACETIKNGDERWPLYGLKRPALVHNDINPIGTVFWLLQWSFLTHKRQNL